MNRKPVAVLGGGFAGLVAARELRRSKIDVRLFEASSQLGGLARTVQDDQGFSFDFGAHFITNRLADELGASGICRVVRHYGEAVRTGAKTYSYPFGLSRRPAYVMSLLAARLAAGNGSIHNAAEQMEALYGQRMAEEIAIPLLEGWSGVPADQLAPAVAEKLDEGIAKTLWLKTAGLISGRAITIGYTREKPSSVKVWHVYPEGGLGTLIDHLAQEQADVIELESPVQSIVVEDGQVRAVKVDDEIIEVAAVMSTAPVHILSRLIEGSSALDVLARFRYRPMVFVNLLLGGRGLLPDTVLWLTDPDSPFFRLTETPLSMPWLAPEGKTTVMADYTADVGDQTWTADDEDLVARTLEALEPIIPKAQKRHIGSRVMRTPIAYPLFLGEYEEERQRFAESTGIRGLYSIGRNGEFAHILMEDVYWRTKRRVAQLEAELETETA